MNLWEFLAALLGERVGSYASAREKLIEKEGITHEQLRAMGKACMQGRFEIK